MDTWKYQYYCSQKIMTGKQDAFQEKWATLPKLSFLHSQFCPPIADLSTALPLLTLQIGSVV